MIILSWNIYFASLALFLWSSPAQCKLVNVTVDDTFGDSSNGRQIAYSPLEIWNLGQTCQGCSASVDRSKASRGTWHDSTFNKDPGSNSRPNTVALASFAFTGSAVYIYCLIAHSVRNPSGRSDMSFYIDGALQGSFVQEPEEREPSVEYNVLVFSNSSLLPGDHSITIQNGHANGLKSLILFDYLIYSTNSGIESNTSSTDSTPPTSSSESPLVGATVSNDTGRLVAAILGPLLALTFICVTVLWWFRYRKPPPADPNRPSSRQLLQQWLDGAPRPISFHPSLLIRRAAYNATPVLPVNTSPGRDLPYLIEPPTTSELYGHSGLMSPHQSPETPHSARMASIIAWQRNASTAARGPGPPPSVERDMSEELSSYYDDDAISIPNPHPSPPAARPPPATPVRSPATPRRFTVVNK